MKTAAGRPRSGTDAASPRGRATRDRIFDAAVAEFSARGFDGARIESIAAAAEVNKQRIYAYFGDKEGLFIEVWNRTYELIYEEDREFLHLGEDDIPRLGRIVLKSYMDFHEAHPEFWRIFVMENFFGGRHENPGDRRHRPHGRLRELYALGQERGFYRREVSFEAFIFVLTGVSSFYASNARTMTGTLGADLSDPGVKDRLIGEMGLMLFGPESSNG